jgi:hypothetical protein
LCKKYIIFVGESVEENANLVIRLLIRRPECLGPALRGEGEGLLRAIIDANKVQSCLYYARHPDTLGNATVFMAFNPFKFGAS